MYSSVSSILPIGSLYEPIKIEAKLLSGLPSFKIVGIPERSARDIKERVYSAIKSSGYKFPSKKVRVSITPSGFPISCEGLDLPVAISILMASAALPSSSGKTAAYGALTLAGELKGCFGMPQFRSFATSLEAESTNCSSLLDACRAIVSSKAAPLSLSKQIELIGKRSPNSSTRLVVNDYIRRVLLITVGGRHNCLIRGPYGIGKSKFLELMSQILPEPVDDELDQLGMMEYKEEGYHFPYSQITPLTHMTDLIGKPSQPGSGILHRSNLGVIAIDEINSLSNRAISLFQECLDRQQHELYICNRPYRIPTKFILAGSMNLCKCGLKGLETNGDTALQCSCSQLDIERHNSRMTPRFLSRFAVRVTLNSNLLDSEGSQSSSKQNEPEQISKSIRLLWNLQRERGGMLNSQLEVTDIDQTIYSSEALDQLSTIRSRERVPLRDCLSIARVARTIADIDGNELVTVENMLEARGLR
ncbi:MAG: magnesium chelatase domain-containing protein [Candidatus Dojkabacteria bacterium]|nr:MAG: magnesium chelatase domain-containing protein [Candidatus Dojkabacteria bacterium]